ncbi:MAG: glycosyltransferase family 4 protein [Planctomycetes bacterium]|nr:glycosyltransferase family 4 protein [Planctomycetota bacterium]MCW8135240.1 glycosyltransferase family 4 protein [Planctomycetota bacterium]
MAAPLIIYRHAIEFPNAHAHSLQVVSNICGLAAEGAEVWFSARSWTADTPQQRFAYYGKQVPEQVVMLDAPQSPGGIRDWRGLRSRWRLRKLVDPARRPVFYLRDNGLNFRTIIDLLKLRNALNARIVLECHTSHQHKAGQEEAKRNMRRWKYAVELEPRAVREVDLLVAVSEGLREQLVGLSGRSGPSVSLRNGTDLPQLAPLPLAQRSGLVYLGHPFAAKGLDDAIKALALLPGERLTVVGGRNDDDIALIRGWAQEAGVADRVTVTGAVRHDLVFEHLLRARVALLPLKHGSGSPLKAFEYMAAGLPIVASDAKANLEIMRESGAGVVVPVKDPAALAGGVRQLLSDLPAAQRMAEGGLAYAREHTWQRRARRLLDEFEKLPAPRDR